MLLYDNFYDNVTIMLHYSVKLSFSQFARAGRVNSNADALSRNPIPETNNSKVMKINEKIKM